MIRNFLFTLALFIAPLLIAPVASAVDVFDNKNICKGSTDASAVCKDKVVRNNNPLYGPQGIITKITNILSIVVGIAAVINIGLAGLKFVTSGSNPQEVTSARERIIYACVALVIVAIAQVMVRYVLSNYN
jgi:hypothetical protein